MLETENKAKELVSKFLLQIEEIRTKVAKQAVESGLDPQFFVLEDNLSEVIEDPKIPYSVRVVPKPRMARGENK